MSVKELPGTPKDEDRSDDRDADQRQAGDDESLGDPLPRLLTPPLFELLDSAPIIAVRH